MTIYHGKNLGLYIGGYDVSALTSAVNIDSPLDMLEYAIPGAGYNHLPGKANGKIGLEGLFDDTIHTVLNTLWAASSTYQIMIPIGTSIGDRGFAASGVWDPKLNWANVTTAITKLTAEFNIEGTPIEECKILQTKVEKTTDGSGTVIDDGAASSSGLIAYLQVFQCGADDALIVKVQTDTTQGFSSPTDLITFTTANGITTERKTVSGAVEQYVRVDWAGTPDYDVYFAVMYKRG